MDESALKVLISNLESSRATLDLWLFIFTLFVVVGVVLEVVFVIWEYRDELHDWRRGIVHPPEKPSITLLVCGLFGAGLAAIGVTGELYIGAKIGAKETSIREANDQRASLLSKLARDAAQSAKTAHAEVGAVTKEADELTTRLGKATKKLRKLEKDLVAQGPRWKALDHGRKEFIAALQPFPRQRLTVVVCGQDDSERNPFEQELMNLVHEAGWAAPDMQTWQGCPTSLTGGNEIFVVSSVTLWQHAVPYSCQGTHDIAGRQGASAAAETLCDALNKRRVSTTAWILAPGNQTDFPKESAPVNQLPIAVWARGFFGFGTTDSPAELAVKEPTKIFILVGAR